MKALALGAALGTLGYIVLVALGVIKAGNRLAPADIALLLFAAGAVTLAWRPELLERLQKLDVAGWKIELGEIKKEQSESLKQQQQQAAVLEDIRLALRLLIGDNERAHLLNLFRRKTGDYRVRGSLRDEIRRLRAMKLLQMRPGHTVGGFPERAVFDLAQYVELTEDGVKLATRLAEDGTVGKAQDVGAGS